jgi:hypothetical protein
VPPKKKAKAGTAPSTSKSKTGKTDSPFSLDEDSEDYSDGGIDWDEAVKSDDLELAKPKKKEVKPASKPKAKAAVAPKRPAMVGALLILGIVVKHTYPCSSARKQNESRPSSSAFLTNADIERKVRDFGGLAQELTEADLLCYTKGTSRCVCKRG